MPAYLVLDEPTAMLDPAGRADVLAVLASLRERGVGIVHVTHHMEDVLSADRAIVLDGGRIAFAGSPLELAGDPGGAERLGVDVPAVVVMARALRAGGIPLPADALSAERIVDALWPS